MTLPDHFLRIAKCGRPKGLKGEVALWPISNVDDRYVQGSIFTSSDYRTFEIEKIRNNKDHYIVKFVDIDDRTAAESIVNVELFAEPLTDDVLEDGEFFIHDCLGKTLVDQTDAPYGIITNVIPNAASDLLETENGELVPFRFITSIDETSVHVDVPEGLLGQ